MALEEWKLRLTSAKVEVEVEAELGKNEYMAILGLEEQLDKVFKAGNKEGVQEEGRGVET